jgi:hypothetical protein
VKRLRIATRQSALALWQAEHVAARLRAAHAGLDIQLVPMTTRGDQIIDRPLAEIGGKGLFLKELEVALQEGRADIAVHSLKDVPMELEPGFAIGAVLERADAADAFISNAHAHLSDLPKGARVGTSSLRRQAQLRALRPDLHLLDLRGNVNTRLAKLDAGQYDAIILACAGLERLGLGERIRSRLSAPDWFAGGGAGGHRHRTTRRRRRRGRAHARARRRGHAPLRGVRAGHESTTAWQLQCSDRGLLHRNGKRASAAWTGRRCKHRSPVAGRVARIRSQRGRDARPTCCSHAAGPGRRGNVGQLKAVALSNKFRSW